MHRPRELCSYHSICSNPASLPVARPIRNQPLRVSSLTSGEFRLPWQHGNSPGACPGRSIAQQREILYCPRSNLIGWSKPSDWQGYFLDFAHKASDPSSPSFANKKAMHCSDRVILVSNLSRYLTCDTQSQDPVISGILDCSKHFSY